MKNFFRMGLGLSLALAAGCSTYDKRFAAAAQTPAASGKFTGAYAGKWMSARHPGGGGKLRCILSPVNASDYLAEFHATWHVFHSEHSVVLHTTPASGKKSGAGAANFSGTSKLRTPIGAGTYTCAGTLRQVAGTGSISANYDATYDQGKFRLQRIPPPRSHRETGEN